jgi:hypothetical protein
MYQAYLPDYYYGQIFKDRYVIVSIIDFYIRLIGIVIILLMNLTAY